MKLNRTGYTLLELFIVVAVLGVLLSAFFSSITSSRMGFQNAGYAIDRQQDARKAVDRISWELRKSSPSWNISETFYNVSINAAGDSIDFYVPVFDADNQITRLTAVRYYTDENQLFRAESDNRLVIANNIDNVVAQKPFFSFNNPERTIVDIKIPVIKNSAVFTLNSQANLRNRQVQLSAGVLVDEIE